MRQDDDEAVKEEVDEIEVQPLSSEDSDEFALVGTNIADRYKLTKKIGQGGMGVVYLAHQEILDRYVVIKILSRSVIADESAVHRFEREAQRLSALNHPNLVTVHDFGRHEGMSYLVMEFVEGETLKQFCSRKGGLDLQEFSRIADQILDALAEAHSQGVMHRDIKPSNIMLYEGHGRRHNVKVLDFGLAKLVSGGGELTKKNELIGSPAYLAPEQILGHPIDIRVDVYALGVLFYYMLSGVKPFVADDEMSLLYQHVHAEPRPLSEVLPEQHDIPPVLMELVVEQCLAKDPDMRPDDARQLRVMFYDWVLQTDPSGSFPSLLYTPSSSRPRPPRALLEVGRDEESATLDEDTDQGGFGPLTTKLSIAGAVLAAGVAGWLYIQSPIGGEDQVATSSTAALESNLGGMLDQVEELANRHKFAQAEMLLARIDDRVLEHPTLMTRAIALEDEVAIGRLFKEAERYEARGATKEAIQNYKEILARDSAHGPANKRLTELVSKNRADQPQGDDQAESRADLQLTSTPSATVYVDDLPVGQTPVDQNVSAGEHVIEFRAAGYETWTKKVSLDPGESKELSGRLRPKTRSSTLEKARNKIATQHNAQQKAKAKSGGRKPADTRTGESETAAAEPKGVEGSDSAGTVEDADAGADADSLVAEKDSPASGTGGNAVELGERTPDQANAAETDVEDNLGSVSKSSDQASEGDDKGVGAVSDAPEEKVEKRRDEAEKSQPKKIASTSLSSNSWIRNTQNLKAVMIGIEREVINRNSLPSSKVRNTTALLYREIHSELVPGASLTVNSKKAYYIIARGVRDGRSRTSIARELVQQYRSGSLR